MTFDSIAAWGFVLYSSFAFAQKSPSEILSQGAVPPENQSKEHFSRIQSFAGKAKELVSALSTGELENVKTLFFPLEPFILLKAIDKPENYHKKLVAWYAADLQRERQILSVPLDFEAFQLGSCKWKEKGSEYNYIAYWSCYKSRIKMRDAKKAIVELEIRTLINFGNEWFITHLGPIPKS